MTIIEVRTLEIISHNLPEIAKQLKRIADALEHYKNEKEEEDNAPVQGHGGSNGTPPYKAGDTAKSKAKRNSYNPNFQKKKKKQG